MRKFIQENNSFSLFFFHLLFPVLEIIIVSVSSLFNPDMNLIIHVAAAIGIGHIALISQIYKSSIAPKPLNYLLSLGKTRQSIFMEILESYAREIIVYTFIIGALSYFTNQGNILMYLGLRLLFSLISFPVFINNILDSNPLYYGVLSLYYILITYNIGVLIVVSIPISVYLTLKFKKKIIHGNLI